MSIEQEVSLGPAAAPDHAHAHSGIAALKSHFPGCFDKHCALLPDKLADALQSAGTPDSREFYSLNWLGKSYARVLSELHPRTIGRAGRHGRGRSPPRAGLHRHNHSAWLTFMYPRLYVARELLCEDGVIVYTNHYDQLGQYDLITTTVLIR